MSTKLKITVTLTTSVISTNDIQWPIHVYMLVMKTIYSDYLCEINFRHSVTKMCIYDIIENYLWSFSLSTNFKSIVTLSPSPLGKWNGWWSVLWKGKSSFIVITILNKHYTGPVFQLFVMFLTRYKLAELFIM